MTAIPLRNSISMHCRATAYFPEREHPELKRPFYKVPHVDGIAGTAAQFVLHVSKRMDRDAKLFRRTRVRIPQVELPSISPLLASAKTRIWPSTILLPTSRPRNVHHRDLDHACRQQQVGEGWFKTVAGVPEQAITMTIRQILKAKSTISVVPDERKAKAVHAILTGEVTPNVPASILQTHPDVTVYLDQASASKL